METPQRNYAESYWNGLDSNAMGAVPLLISAVDPTHPQFELLADLLEETRIRCQRDGFPVQSYHVTVHQYLITLQQIEIRNELQNTYEQQHTILPVKKTPLPNSSRAGKHITAYKKRQSLDTSSTVTGGDTVLSDTNENTVKTESNKQYITIRDHRTPEQINTLQSIDIAKAETIRPRSLYIFRLWHNNCFSGAMNTSAGDPSELNRDYWYIDMKGYFITSNAYKYCPDWTACSVTEQVLNGQDSADALNKLLQASMAKSMQTDAPRIKRPYTKRDSITPVVKPLQVTPKLTATGRIAKKRGRKPKNESYGSLISPHSNYTLSPQSQRFTRSYVSHLWLQLSTGLIDSEKTNHAVDDDSDTESDIEQMIEFISHSNGTCKPKYFTTIELQYDTDDTNDTDSTEQRSENITIEQDTTIHART